MHRLGMSRRRTQHISKELIRQRLEDSDPESDGEVDTASLELTCQDRTIRKWAPVGDLLSCKSWLDQICDEAQARFDKASEDDSRPLSSNSHTEQASKTQNHGCCEGADSQTLDTDILQRIREGRGPRDEVSEDLLAVFRDKDLQRDKEESYEDMRNVLLSWNRRVSSTLREGENSRVMLRLAVERRGSLLRSCDHGTDGRQELEESSAELLQALTALRPEIAEFHRQSSFDILVMLWANVRIAIPDMDDELKLLTMEALIDEVKSRSQTVNADKLSGLARSLSVAKLEHNIAEIERLTMKIQAFERKMRDTVVRKVIDKIKAMRRGLTQIKLKELQELTELQAAQKWAAHKSLGDRQLKQDQTRACDQADGQLQRILQQQVPELDAHIQVVQHNASGLASMSASLLSRAEEAGFSLEDHHPSASVELATADIKTYVSGTITDIFNARREAEKMLERMGIIESYLEDMLDAAKSQYRAYDDVLGVLEDAESSDDDEAGLARKYGPRRESILLMARNTQRAKQS
ncbi:hypothetical protein C7974DRAFT_383949 [Boeremia exigua]|uniref:uncharacterized protein n=1 Tax=Boeremia exigua TaxID=749465 RepID=UPI001E8ED54F|nr:uncharacterized protein C7974DRAFT_383949 [Boeremia exigua]KAH6644615.1 hypothetical protein C7974DRAFT_383949 [Boeremia exigua]